MAKSPPNVGQIIQKKAKDLTGAKKKPQKRTAASRIRRG